MYGELRSRFHNILDKLPLGRTGTCRKRGNALEVNKPVTVECVVPVIIVRR